MCGRANAYEPTQKLISDAMRELLESFRLPGEAQQIARITEVFAEAYYNAQDPAKDMMVKSEDAAYVLSYSVIMLNTDQHNPQNVKNRMKYEDYKKNLRGVNDRADFDSEFLVSGDRIGRAGVHVGRSTPSTKTSESERSSCRRSTRASSALNMPGASCSNGARTPETAS
jgi:hypothetical protein